MAPPRHSAAVHRALRREALVRLEDASSEPHPEWSTGPACGVRWNFTLYLWTGDGAAKSAAFPAIHMTGGRVNFKFGDTKSIFYLLDTDVDLSPSATPSGPLNIRATGQPRPRRQALRVASAVLVANGQWNSADPARSELDVRTGKGAELSDVLSLFEGGKPSLLRQYLGRCTHLAGPMPALSASQVASTFPICTAGISFRPAATRGRSLSAVRSMRPDSALNCRPAAQASHRRSARASAWPIILAVSNT